MTGRIHSSETQDGDGAAGKTLAYGSSLRERPVAVTLEHACRLGAQLGITRVTDITRLDRPGIPVCVSIRPNAMPGSLCVNAGKGFTPADARVGAWMEAIEYALAEPGASPVPYVEATARDVLDGHERPDAILDLCPRMGAEIDLDAPLTCVEAVELLTGASLLVPAELVFLPAVSGMRGGWFGATSCGLASGNTLLEATVHALAEVIEHDIRSFQYLEQRSVPVNPATFPEQGRELAQALERVGLSLQVRYQPNVFGLPFFEATIRDPESASGLFYNGGYGCHPHAAIALVRALCEAAQSRLSLIHGGRDDLSDWAHLESTITSQDLSADESPTDDPPFSSPSEEIEFARIPDLAAEAATLEDCFAVLIRSLSEADLHRICRVVFTKPEDALQVVRVIVPGMETFHTFSPRVGRRLHACASRI